MGKPNPLMMRSALRALGTHSENDADDRRPDGHRRAGPVWRPVCSTILVLSGISSAGTEERFPYRPSKVIGSIADLIERVENPFDD